MGLDDHDVSVIQPSTIFERLWTVIVFAFCIATGPISSPLLIIAGGFQRKSFMPIPKPYNKWWGRVYGILIGATYYFVIHPIYWSGQSFTMETVKLLACVFIITDIVARRPVE